MRVESVLAPVFDIVHEELCSRCHQKPTYIGTMCQDCYEEQAYPPKAHCHVAVTEGGDSDGTLDKGAVGRRQPAWRE